ncbi:MAG: histidine kinase-, DNA gyrase B-, and HSP90-like ATPase [Halonotius sp. J07HN6]|nr:MAG: histidine kinase-, DNA gyrase B-, and HSP90-like ATPase [Halonotius sp. J07HN6]
MSNQHGRIRVLYELALAIGPAETLQATAEQAISAYLQRLNCSLGAVFTETADAEGYEPVAALPTNADTDTLYTEGKDRLSSWAAKSPDDRRSLPLTGEPESDSHYYLFELPDFGVLLLGQYGSGLDPSVVDALDPLNDKLATACTTKQVEGQLREERNRFEAIFTTIQEPVVNVSLDGDTPTIKRANEAFRETFGDPETGSDALSSTGRFEPTTPVDADSAETAELIEACLVRGQPVTEEVRRQTTSGVGDFLLRAVPVADGDEFFAMYIDITAEKRRRRTLESLYDEAQEVLTSQDRQTTCDRAVSTALSIIDADVAEVCLYDRGEDSLVPAASTSDAPVFEAGRVAVGNLLWVTYEGASRRIDHLETADGLLPHSGRQIQSALLFPLGEHGVIAIADSQQDAFDETDFQFAQLLAALVEITLDRAQRQQSLESVQELTQETLTTETPEEMIEPVLERLPDALNLPITGFWQYNRARNQLEPLAMTEAASELIEIPPTFGPGSSIAWEAFTSGETKIISDVGDRDDAYNEESPIRSEVIAPIGEYGVLMAGSVRSHTVTEIDRNIASTLGSTLDTSLQLINNRQELDLLDQVLGRVLRHNIRNELNVMKGYARVLIEETDDEHTQFAENILENCNSLEQTANNARDMQRVVQSRDSRKSVAVDSIIDDAIEQAREEQSTTADIVVDRQTGGDILAHPKLPTAVLHLVKNGLEHGVKENPDAEQVRVTTYEADGKTVIEVEDDGPGIPEDELAVLDRHGESALEHGSGVGLWLVDRIVEYSEATIEFETRPGTTARIHLEQA